jgi:hypothetical protein
VEASPDRILVRPSQSGLIIVSLIYTAVELAIALVVDQLVLGGIVAGIRMQLAALALCVWVPLQAAFSWYVCSFEIDAAGLHQNHVLAQVNRILRHLPPDNSIGWQDHVWLMKHTRYVAAVCYRVPEGGLLSWLRSFPRMTWIILPWKWLVADIERLQSMLQQYAPLDHPLREFYGVSDDSAFRVEQES